MEVLLVTVHEVGDRDEDARRVRQRLAQTLRTHLGARRLRLVGQPRERVEELTDAGRVRVTVSARAAPDPCASGPALP